MYFSLIAKFIKVVRTYQNYKTYTVNFQQLKNSKATNKHFFPYFNKAEIISIILTRENRNSAFCLTVSELELLQPHLENRNSIF